MFNRDLLSILVCPRCKGALSLKEVESELECAPCRLAYPIREGIPRLLVEEARKIEGDQIR